jgi:hypothetical protein
MFTSRLFKPTIDDETKHVYQKALSRLTEIHRRLSPTIDSPGMHSQLCLVTTRQLLTQHKQRIETINKMLNNEAITMDELKHLLHWSGIKNNQAFKQYPNIIQSVARRLTD